MRGAICSDDLQGALPYHIQYDEEKGPVAQPGGPSSWLNSYQSSMNNATVDRAVSAAVNCDWWFSLQSLTGHTTPIESLQINTNEELIVAGSQSGSIRVWDLEAAKSMFP